MILVTGANGMLGSYLVSAYSNDELYLTDRASLEIRDYSAVQNLIKKVNPETIIHLAAETDVDRCEREEDHAYLTNTIGTQNIALACQKYDIEMVYVSTMGVFDGNKPGPYTEFDQPDPVNVYARSKWEGEKIVQTLLQRFYVLRIGWIFGGGKVKDKKFVGKIVSLCLEYPEIKVIDDKIGNPTYAKDVAFAIKQLTKTNYYGLYHITNKDFCTRYDCAKEIVKNIGSKTNVIPVNSAAFPLPAPRPRSEAARNYKLELMGLNHLRPWKEALAEYLLELNDDGL